MREVLFNLIIARPDPVVMAAIHAETTHHHLTAAVDPHYATGAQPPGMENADKSRFARSLAVLLPKLHLHAVAKSVRNGGEGRQRGLKNQSQSPLRSTKFGAQVQHVRVARKEIDDHDSAANLWRSGHASREPGWARLRIGFHTNLDCLDRFLFEHCL